MPLEADEVIAGAGVAGRYRATGAGIATFEMNFADSEANDATFLFAEELVFPECGDAVDLERGAETTANIFEREAGKAVSSGGKPLSYSLERSGGNDGGTVGDRVVGKTTF